MKFSFTKKLFLGVFCCLFLVTGCKNFFTGEDFVKQLDESILEASAPTVDFYIDVDANTGTASPNGKVSYKIGQTFTVLFTESKEYEFVKWEVINRETKSSLEDIIEIVSTKDNETKFKLLASTSNISLHPVCIERPSVDSYSPKYSDSGVSRDSSIILTFTKDLSEENDFSNITITSNGSSVKDCYKEPVLNGSILTFAADPSNLLDTAGGLKSITVTVPADIYYESSEGDSTLGSEFSWTFKVNGSTDKKSEVTFAVSEEKGTITPNGTKNYSIGEDVDLKFEPEEGYIFNGWIILDGDGKSAADSLVKVADKKAADTTITIVSAAKGISISPDCLILPKVKDATPKYISAGTNCDTPIVITFNSKMDSTQLESFEYIKIEDKNKNNLSDYFRTPVLSEDGLTLSIKTNAAKPLVAKDDNSSRVVYVTLDSSIANADGTFTLKDSYGPNGYSFYYSANKNKSTSKPVLNSVELALTLEDLNNPQKLFTKEFTEINHFKDAIAISCNASDDIGIDGVKITATRKYDTAGNADTRNTSKTILCGTNAFTEQNDGTYSAKTILNLKELSSIGDGILQIDVAVQNFSGLASEKTYEFMLLKDTVNGCENWKISNNKYASKDAYAVGDTLDAEDIWSGSTGTTTLTWSVTGETWGKYNSVEYKTENTEFKYKLEWGQNYDNLSNSVPVTNIDDSGNCSYTISIDDKNKDTYVKITATDLVGNESSYEVAVPGASSVLYTTNSGTSYSYYFDNSCNENLPCLNGKALFDVHVIELHSKIKSSSSSVNKNYNSFNISPYLSNHSVLLQKCYKYANDIILWSPFGDEYAIVYGGNAATTEPIYIYDCKVEQTDIPNSGDVKITGMVANYNPDLKYYVVTNKYQNNSGSISKTDYKMVPVSFTQITGSSGLSVNGKSYHRYQFNTTGYYSSYQGSIEIIAVSDGIKVPVYYVPNATINGLIFNSNANELKSESYSYSPSSYDSIAPKFTTSLSTAYSTPGNAYSLYGYDNETGLKNATNSSGNTEYEYFWLPYDNSEKSDGKPYIRSLTNEEFITNDITYGTSYIGNYPAQKEIELYPKDLVDGNKYVGYVKIFDTCGNYAIGNTSVYCMATLNNKLSCEYIGSQYQLSINYEAVDNSKFYDSIQSSSISNYFNYSVFSGNCWISKSSGDTVSKTNGPISSYYSITYSLTADRYYRANFTHEENIKINNNYTTNILYHSNVCYFWTGSDKTTNLKNMIDGTEGVTIITDKPCLYYICSSEIGYGRNQDEWERRGAHINPRQTSGPATVDTSNVSSGDYYVVIAHFVDGTSIMSPVHQKQ